MSYNVYLYHPDVKAAAADGAEIDEIELPVIPDEVRQRFVERLLEYDYELETKDSNCAEYIHKNRKWSIQVAVFRTEIAFSIPYWEDGEHAIIDALQTTHELCDTGEMVVFDSQTGNWGEM
jgi:hypothetical protein